MTSTITVATAMIRSFCVINLRRGLGGAGTLGGDGSVGFSLCYTGNVVARQLSTKQSRRAELLFEQDGPPTEWLRPCSFKVTTL
jgi:hypothetical protein